MAPKRGPSTESAKAKAAASAKTSSKGSNSKVSKKGPKLPPPKQQKTRSAGRPAKKKQRVYTDEELGIPKLNMITPIGVQKPRGKKKGKVFVDDPVSTSGTICTP
jgi:60S ribosomal subunit assembly/export protein LOC1